MLIVDFPTLINPIEYVEFFNPSGICELRLNKSKLKFKYDWLVQYIRSRGLNDAENITALLDYKTGKSLSKNLRQYSQFTIIRHISRHILINDTYFWEAMGMRSKSEFTIADHSNSTLSSHDFIEIIRHDSYKILLDDFDFVIGTLKYFVHDIDISCQIPDRIKLNKKFIKTILSDYPDHIDHIANFIETVKPPCLRDIQFVLSLKNIIYIYTELSYELQINIDIVDKLWRQYIRESDDSDNGCNFNSSRIYNCLTNTIHPEIIIKYNIFDRYDIETDDIIIMYKDLPTNVKSDKNILIYMICRIYGNCGVRNAISTYIDSHDMTYETFIDVLRCKHSNKPNNGTPEYIIFNVFNTELRINITRYVINDAINSGIMSCKEFIDLLRAKN
jgi:hypothetical protein